MCHRTSGAGGFSVRDSGQYLKEKHSMNPWIFPRCMHIHDWMHKWLVTQFVSSLIRQRRSFYFQMTFVSSPPLITKRFCQF